MIDDGIAPETARKSLIIFPEHLWNIYSSVKDWIIFSDAKAGAILALYGVGGGIIAPIVIDHFMDINSNYAVLVVFLTSVLFSIYAIIFSIACIKPISDRSNPKSLIYFLHIAEKYPDSESYSLALTEALQSEGTMIDQVARQIHSLSCVAAKKYNKVSWAIYALILSISSSILLFLFLLLR